MKCIVITKSQTILDLPMIRAMKTTEINELISHKNIRVKPYVLEIVTLDHDKSEPIWKSHPERRETMVKSTSAVK